MLKASQNIFSKLILLLAIGLMPVALYMVFIYAPEEASMGAVQRIFYFHVSSAWIAFFSYFVVFIGSLGYLIRRSSRMDSLAHGAGEVGFVFCSLVLITGPLWAKPVWGIWWPWDARITSTFVLWLLYASYVVVRHFFEESGRSATLAAVVGIIGFIDVPVVYFSIRWWRTHHPAPVIMGGEGSGLDPQMYTTLWVTMAAFLALFSYLLWQVYTLRRVESKIFSIRRQLVILGLK